MNRGKKNEVPADAGNVWDDEFENLEEKGEQFDGVLPESKDRTKTGRKKKIISISAGSVDAEIEVDDDDDEELTLADGEDVEHDGGAFMGSGSGNESKFSAEPRNWGGIEDSDDAE
ncbi:MAG: hypothetical protein LBS87_01655, partial [Puniceicoccales bacterium]|nr:hypothetical protein [Puniceicoccales bacterium]